MGIEKYKPEQIEEIEESRKKSDDELKSRGAETKEGGRLEITAKQEEKIKREAPLPKELHRKIDDLDLRIEWGETGNWGKLLITSEDGESIECQLLGRGGQKFVKESFEFAVQLSREGLSPQEIREKLELRQKEK